MKPLAKAAAAAAGDTASAEDGGLPDDDEELDFAETDLLLPPSALGQAGSGGKTPTVVVKRRRRKKLGDSGGGGGGACSCGALLASYSRSAELRPFATQMATCAVLLGCSDLTEQLLVERRSWCAAALPRMLLQRVLTVPTRREDFDGGVVLAVVIYGVVYNGPMNVVVYRFYEAAYREERLGRVASILAKVSTDQLVSAPFIYIPAYYIITGLVRLHPPGKVWTTFLDAWFDSVRTGWSIFIVGQLVNFSLIPVHLRTAFVMVLTFVFNVLLALVDAEAEAAEAEEAALEMGSAPG